MSGPELLGGYMQYLSDVTQAVRGAHSAGWTLAEAMERIPFALDRPLLPARGSPADWLLPGPSQLQRDEDPRVLHGVTAPECGSSSLQHPVRVATRKERWDERLGVLFCLGAVFVYKFRP